MVDFIEAPHQASAANRTITVPADHVISYRPSSLAAEAAQLCRVIRLFLGDDSLCTGGVFASVQDVMQLTPGGWKSTILEAASSPKVDRHSVKS
jgi:hypothetical protein